jgi:hypothetical protein
MALKAFALASVFVLFLTTIGSGNFWDFTKENMPGSGIIKIGEAGIKTWVDPTTENTENLVRTSAKAGISGAIKSIVTGPIMAGGSMVVATIAAAPLTVTGVVAIGVGTVLTVAAITVTNKILSYVTDPAADTVIDVTTGAISGVGEYIESTDGRSSIISKPYVITGQEITQNPSIEEILKKSTATRSASAGTSQNPQPNTQETTQTTSQPVTQPVNQPPVTQETTQTTSQPVSTKFSVGAKVEVTDSLNVRNAPGTSSGTVTSTKTAGSTAKVLSGPYNVDGFTWWEVQYDDGTKGYSEDKRLELMPANQPSVTQPLVDKQPVTTSPTDTSNSNTQGTAPITSQSTNTKFPIGAKIATTNVLNVRNAPGTSSSTIISTKTTGSTGTTIAGPIYADGFTWWQIQYDDGTTGWSEDKRLESVPANQKTTAAVDALSFGISQGLEPITQESSQSTEKAETQDTTTAAVDALSIGTSQGSQSSTQEMPKPTETADTKETTAAASDAPSFGDSTSFGSSSEKNALAGINFTSIKLNSISVSTDSSGGVNFDLILKAQKAEGAGPGIDLINSTQLGATAFMTGLVIPEYKFWVSMDPRDPDRIIDEQLGQTDVGRIMLEADLQMKKDFHLYDNPCANETGKAFWNLLNKKRDALVEKCIMMYPEERQNIENVRFYSVDRHVILPDKIYAYTNGTQIYIINATLTIKNQPEYDLCTFNVDGQNSAALSKGCREELNKSAIDFGQYFNDLQNDMISPYVVADVNQGEKFEDLRNVYTSLALAQWYKSRISSDIDIFRSMRETSNSTMLVSLEPWSPKEIWNRYVYSFKNGEYSFYYLGNGEYNCRANDTAKMPLETNTESDSTIHVIHMGGVDLYSIVDHLVAPKVMPSNVQNLVNRNLSSFDTKISDDKRMPSAVQNQVDKAVRDGFANEEKDILFGTRLHLAPRHDILIQGSSSGSSPDHEKSKQNTMNYSKENQTEKAINLSNENLAQKEGTSKVKKNAGNASQIICPEGWMGPDEKGECWKLQITSKK